MFLVVFGFGSLAVLVLKSIPTIKSIVKQVGMHLIIGFSITRLVVLHIQCGDSSLCAGGKIIGSLPLSWSTWKTSGLFAQLLTNWLYKVVIMPLARPIISCRSFPFGRMFRCTAFVLMAIMRDVFPNSFGNATMIEMTWLSQFSPKKKMSVYVFFEVPSEHFVDEHITFDYVMFSHFACYRCKLHFLHRCNKFFSKSVTAPLAIKFHQCLQTSQSATLSSNGGIAANM